MTESPEQGSEKVTDIFMHVDGLVEALSDARLFADTDMEMLSLRGVWLDWDGTTLRFCATDRYVFAEIARVPAVVAEIGQPRVGLIRNDHIDAVLAVARLRRSLDYDEALTRLVWADGTLTVTGAAAPATTDSGPWPGASITVPCTDSTGPWSCPLPLYRKLLDQSAAPIDAIRISPWLLEKFARVSSEGQPIDLRFTAPDGLVHVRIGEWLVGGIMPIRQPTEVEPEPVQAVRCVGPTAATAAVR